MNADQLLAHYERIADAPDAIARLRRFILDLAVRGKLVPQDPKDEPASELLKRIEKEKAHLFRKGELKGPSEILTVEADEAWLIPKCWNFIPLEALSTPNGIFTDGDWVESKDQDPSGIVRLIQLADVGVGEYRDRSARFMNEATATRLNCTFLQRGDILIARMPDPLGRACMFPGDRKASVTVVDVAILRLGSTQFDASFVVHAINSPQFAKNVTAKAAGTTRSRISRGNLSQLAFPLPPIAEQRRIVAKVNELMALCDRLEYTRTEREATRDRLAASSLMRLSAPDPDPASFADHARFALNNLPALTTRTDQIKQLRQTILNLAVRGKLVPQDPKDEPASELLNQIAMERDVLLKERVIRREMPLDPIADGELPFPIPAKWVWSRIGNAVLFTQYGTSQKSISANDGVPVLTMGNIQDGVVVWGSEKKIPASSEDLPALYLKKYDILYNRTNSAELVGKTGIYLGEPDCRTFASYLIRIRASHASFSPYYLNIAMNAPKFRESQIIPLIKKQTGQANVNGTSLKNMLIPVPPYAEQCRIANKVAELMALCDLLEARLSADVDSRHRLLDALLREALSPAQAELQAAE